MIGPPGKTEAHRDAYTREMKRYSTQRHAKDYADEHRKQIRLVECVDRVAYKGFNLVDGLLFTHHHNLVAELQPQVGAASKGTPLR